ncbi:MAG: hypothetical protein ABI411_04690 [Tahibacter sp.]
MRQNSWFLPAALLTAALIGTLWVTHTQKPVARAPGVLVAEVPHQTDLATPQPLPDHAGSKLSALAKFDLQARVLSREDYRFDRGAALAPIDLALGWQRMSDSSVLDQIEISQGNRFFYWRVHDFPIPETELETSAANMHLIPATETVERDLRRTRAGDIVSLHGWLVEASMADGGTWRSSMTRSDTGFGACELILVEGVEIAPR